MEIVEPISAPVMAALMPMDEIALPCRRSALSHVQGRVELDTQNGQALPAEGVDGGALRGEVDHAAIGLPSGAVSFTTLT